MGWEDPGGKLTVGSDCISGNVGNSWAPETGSFRGGCWGVDVFAAGGVPKVEFHWLEMMN